MSFSWWFFLSSKNENCLVKRIIIIIIIIIVIVVVVIIVIDDIIIFIIIIIIIIIITYKLATMSPFVGHPLYLEDNTNALYQCWFFKIFLYFFVFMSVSCLIYSQDF